MNKDGYPSKHELKKIRNWSFKKSSPVDLINYIHDRWAYAESGYFKMRGKKVIYLELHTAGWSGNEDIIRELENNLIFWGMCWYKHIRGGHFYFKVELERFIFASKKNKNEKRK